MHKTLSVHFSTGVRWNLFEALVYQVLYVTHYTALFYVLDIKAYGTVVTLLSTLYLAVSISNCGLEQTMATFYTQLTESKYNFYTLLSRHFKFQIYFLFSLSIAYMWFTQGTLVSIALLFILEGVKKILRSLLQYAFCNKITAHIEIGSLLLYIMGIWTHYIWESSVSQKLLIDWLVLTSGISTLLLGFFAAQWYKNLPTANHTLIPPLQKKLIKQRMLSTLQTIFDHFFSLQTLITLCALKWGASYAGVISFIGTFSYTSTLILRKTFRRLTYRILSHIHTTDPAHLPFTFARLTNTMNQCVSLITAVLTLLAPFLHRAAHAKQEGPVSLLLVLLVLALPFIGHACSYYKCLFTIAECTHTLVWCNGMAVIFISMAFYWTTTPLQFVTAILVIKLVKYFYLSYFAQRKWSVRVSWRINPTHSFALMLSMNKKRSIFDELNLQG